MARKCHFYFGMTQHYIIVTQKMSEQSIIAPILIPVIKNRFQLTQFGHIVGNKLEVLQKQLISVDISLNKNKSKNYHPSFIVTLIFEDDVPGYVHNSLMSAHKLLAAIYDLEFDIDSIGGTPKTSFMTITNARLLDYNYDLNYASSETAKHVLTFGTDYISRTTTVIH